MIRRVLRLRRKINFLYQERIRIEKLKIIERKLLFSGFRCIAGLDEVGRGALAGPVVAAAVVLRDIGSFYITDLKDSKKIGKNKREFLYKLIIEKASDIGIGLSSPSTIDRINILKATLLAMTRAIASLSQRPDYLLIDALKIPFIETEQESIIKGEDRCISIATASIVAKVYRDNLMKEFHKKYPIYLFNQNMGYGTKKHFAAIKTNGICPIHRKTFKGVIVSNTNTQ